jgi:hypothetical protein
MKSFRIALPVALLLGAGVMLVDVGAAQAMTCESTCNQIRRACSSVAKSALNVEYANCDDGRDVCRVACEANAEQCPIDCDTAHTTCVSGGGVDCDATRAQCLDACAHCGSYCNAERVACRDVAKAVRADANLLCDSLRESCDTTCVDPIDEACVRDCRTTSSTCAGDAKGDEKTCHAACPRGTDQRACMRSCRRDKNAALGLCSDQEVLCIGVCAGLP